jgi:hypothetical protein
MGDQIRAREAELLEAEITLLDNIRWAVKDHPERAWEIVSKMIEGKAKALNDLLGSRPR